MKKEKRVYFKDLEKGVKLMKVSDAPIFYHHSECDCITCRARLEKGGLDHDPSNDDEEFIEHERQVFRDKGITEKEDK
jgi:ferredoxin